MGARALLHALNRDYLHRALLRARFPPTSRSLDGSILLVNKRTARSRRDVFLGVLCYDVSEGRNFLQLNVSTSLVERRTDGYNKNRTATTLFYSRASRAFQTFSCDRVSEAFLCRRVARFDARDSPSLLRERESNDLVRIRQSLLQPFPLLIRGRTGVYARLPPVS